MILATRTPAHKKQTSMSRMVVTPAMAENWLAHANTNNRRISDAHVRRLARDMTNGDWVLTHEGVAFDPSGVLLDGQHRLRAIVYSQTPIELNVWRNVTREALMAIDSGRTRSVGDILHLSGNHGRTGNREMSILRSMLGGLTGAVTLTPSQASVELSRHATAIAFSLDALPNQKQVANAITRAVIARAYYSADHCKITEFCMMLRTGVVPTNDAISVVILRQYLFDNPTTSTQSRRIRYAKTERALAAFLTGTQISRLYAVTEERFPLPRELEGVESVGVSE